MPRNHVTIEDTPLGSLASMKRVYAAKKTIREGDKDTITDEQWKVIEKRLIPDLS